jgi:hypothetical protein
MAISHCTRGRHTCGVVDHSRHSAGVPAGVSAIRLQRIHPGYGSSPSHGVPALQRACHAQLVPCPCDRCPYAAMCCDLLLACRAFSQFVRGAQWRKTTRKPTRERYLRLFTHESSGEPPC